MIAVKIRHNSSAKIMLEKRGRHGFCSPTHRRSTLLHSSTDAGGGLTACFKAGCTKSCHVNGSRRMVQRMQYQMAGATLQLTDIL